jgi:hypothetical protein
MPPGGQLQSVSDDYPLPIGHLSLRLDDSTLWENVKNLGVALAVNRSLGCITRKPEKRPLPIPMRGVEAWRGG